LSKAATDNVTILTHSYLDGYTQNTSRPFGGGLERYVHALCQVISGMGLRPVVHQLSYFGAFDTVYEGVRVLYGKAVNGYEEPGSISPPLTGAARSESHFFSEASTSASLGILGGTVNIPISLNNPSASGKKLLLSSIGGTIDVSLSLLSNFSGQVNIYSGGTLTAPSTVTASNLYVASAVTSVAEVTSSTSAPTGGTAFMTYPVFPQPFRFTYTGGIAVPEGESLVINVVGSLSLLGLIGTEVNISWWEA